MENFAKIADVEMAPFRAELDAAPEMWLADTSRQRNVRCQRQTRNIFLRTAKKPLPLGARNANDVHESRTAAAAAGFPQTLAFCARVANDRKASLGRVVLVALKPNGRVFPHVDKGAYYRIRDRYHLVVQSPQGSPLTVGEETLVMREGELWVIDNKLKHSAKNASQQWRVHLIFDLLPPVGQGHYVAAERHKGLMSENRQ